MNEVDSDVFKLGVVRIEETKSPSKPLALVKPHLHVEIDGFRLCSTDDTGILKNSNSDDGG